MAYNYSKLIGKIIEVYGSRKNFASAIGFSERTMVLKLHGEVDWKKNEMLKTCELLNIPLESIVDYFFAV